MHRRIQPSRPAEGGGDRLSLLATTAAAELAFAVVALLAAKVHHGDAPLAVDSLGARVADSARLRPSHFVAVGSGSISHRLVWLGSPAATVLLALLLAAVAWRWRDRIGTSLALVAPLVAGLMTESVLKPLVDRRLRGGALSFPSGHATGIAAIVAVALVLIHRRYGIWWAGRAAPVLGVAVVAVGLSLVRLDWHYPTDVVGGAATAVGTVLLVLVGVESADRHLRRRVRART